MISNPLYFILINLALSVVAYLWGSLNTSIVVSKYLLKSDIRQHGSGNAGSTNITRKFGLKVGASIFVFDILKVYLFSIMVMLINWYAIGYEQTNTLISPYTLLPQVSSFFIMIGHIFPIFFRFKGGKGAATVVGFFVTTNFILFLIGTIFWVTLLFTKKIVSVATIFANLLCIPFFFIPWMTDGPLGFVVPDGELINSSYPSGAIITGVVYLVAVIIIIAMHHSNIKRLLKKQEKIIFSKK